MNTSRKTTTPRKPRAKKAVEPKVVESVSNSKAHIVVSFIIYAALISVVAAVLYTKVRTPSDDSKPQPKPDVVDYDPNVSFEAYSNFSKSLMKNYKEAFTSVAVEVKSGAIKTDKELYEALKPRLVKGRTDAQQSLDESLHKDLPRNSDGTFDNAESKNSDKAHKYLLKLASEL
jgi:hypothetical protein